MTMRSAFCVLALLAGVQVSYAAGDLEWNTDRPGGDITNFDLPVDNPKMCQDACGGDPRCQAFTYVRVGVQSPTRARCWLKSVVPGAASNTCCVSGTKLQ